MANVNEKQQQQQQQNKAVNLSHHLSELAKRRQLSPLKGLQKYFRPGSIQLSGGLPSPSYFPFATVSSDTLVHDAFPLSLPVEASPAQSSSSSLNWFWRLFGSSENTSKIIIPKAPSSTDNGINLSVALQYGAATGLQALQDFIQHFSGAVYKPQYSDFKTLVHTGNTDGWGRVVYTLLNPGDMILAEEWTYPSALASAKPYGVGVVPVGMDSVGMSAVDLKRILDGWDESKDGRKPRLIYTVPVGQNPSGATMGLQRKKEIYDVCVEHDVLICEDDPYYFLQVGEYVPKTSRQSPTNEQQDDAHFLASLAPSFLNVDYQGRVIRLDTFSKTIAPGVRLGWFTCHPLFAERFERQGETSTQAPCGLGQSLVTKLLVTWKFEGYVRWLRGLRMQYQLRRDLFLDILSEEFDLSTSIGSSSMGSWAGMTVYTGYSKPSSSLFPFMTEKSSYARKKMISFVAPSSGMFVWLKLHFDDVPAPDPEDEESTEVKLWVKLAEAGVLAAPGWFFAADGVEPPSDPNVEGHMRMSFSNADVESMKKGLKIFSKTMHDFHRAL